MFQEVHHWLADNPPMLCYGVAVFDADGDGADEVFVTGFGAEGRRGAANRILKWDGTALHDIADAALADAERQAIGAAAADIDGDGREELYILNTDTFGGVKRVGDRLFAFNGEAWVDLFTLPMNARAQNLVAGRSVAAVDRNSDGRYGLFIASYGGPMRLYELDDDGALYDAAPSAGVAITTGGRSLLAFPIVSPRMDIYAGNENGPNFLLRNETDGSFTNVTRRAALEDMRGHARGMAPLDANGNGLVDLVVANWEGPNRLFIQQRDGSFRDEAPQDFALPGRVRTVIVADFDNDGHDEVLFNNIGEPNRLFRLSDGQPVAVDMGDAREPAGLGTGAAVLDLDGDGLLELVIAHGESAAQPLSIYRVPSQGRHYLRLRVLTRFGAPARGAVVRLDADGQRSLRVIDSGSGYLCQMEPVAHFGLGARPPRTLDVTVTWPGGATTKLTNPTIDTTHVITHPA